MFPVQCEELRINHLTPLLVVTMPYACWFLWRVDYIEDFKWCLHFQFGVAFWRVVLRKVFFEGPNCVWRELKTSILNIGWVCLVGYIIGRVGLRKERASFGCRGSGECRWGAWRRGHLLMMSWWEYWTNPRVDRVWAGGMHAWLPSSTTRSNPLIIVANYLPTTLNTPPYLCNN